MRGFVKTYDKRVLVNSNAIVTVKQNGFVIYQLLHSLVFEIKDPMPLSSGNLRHNQRNKLQNYTFVALI